MKLQRRRGGFLLALAVILFCAVALWFFWPEISWRMGWDGKKPTSRSTGTPKEKLSEEDRRKLDELLKQKQSR